MEYPQPLRLRRSNERLSTDDSDYFPRVQHMDIESQQLFSKEEKPAPNWLRWMPLAALIVSFCSFMFAIFVLYPWHIELSKEFTALSKKIASCQ